MRGRRQAGGGGGVRTRAHRCRRLRCQVPRPPPATRGTRRSSGLTSFSIFLSDISPGRIVSSRFEGFAMRTTYTCPDISVLNKLALGLLTPEEIGQLQEHLGRCPDCLDAVEALPTDDPLLRAMQCPTTTPRPDDEAIERLIEHLRDNRPSAPR